MPQAALKNNLLTILDSFDTQGPESTEAFSKEWVKAFIGEGDYEPYAINSKVSGKAILGDYQDARSNMEIAFLDMCTLGEKGIGSPDIASQKFGETFSSFYSSVIWIPQPPYFLAVLNPASVEIAKIQLMTQLGISFASPGSTRESSADSMANIFHTFCTSLQLFCTRPDPSPPYIVIETANLEV